MNRGSVTDLRLDLVKGGCDTGGAVWPGTPVDWVTCMVVYAIVVTYSMDASWPLFFVFFSN